MTAGAQVGEFVLEAPLAKGGQGTVWRARHARTGARAALKRLRDASPSAVARFAQEARLLEHLEAPGLPRLLGRGQDAEGPWLAVELIEGEPLSATIARGRLPVDAAARLVVAVARTLAACHARGVIHRDVKAQNIIVEAGTGRPVLVDLGLARRDPNQLHLASLDDAGGPGLSVSGSVKGTPETMAPEQVNAKTFGPVGPWTDVYGLGAVLYHALTGEPPFRGGAAVVVMRKVTRQPPRDPRELRPDLPAALAAVTLRALEKQPAARFASVAELAAAVAAAAGVSDAGPPAPLPRGPGPAPGPLLSTPPADSDPPRRAVLPQRLPRPGERFAGCTLERELGRGGQGAVYAARRDGDGAAVAIKILLGAVDEEHRARFAREGQAGREVAHPGLVRVLGQGEERGLLYLVMELLEGARPLDLFAAERGLDVRARARLLADVAEAVDAAHAAGLVHRDLKPPNILVTPDGRPHVVDLGLARHLDKERLTLSGQVFGTVAYMAPEQVLGRGAQADARTDVWALGVLLHELVAGAQPFQGDTAIEVMAGIIDDAPPDPCRGVAGAPAGLAEVIATALQKDPAARYPTAAALARDLASVVAGRGAPFARRRARQAPAPRRPLVAGLVLAVGVVAAAAAGVALRRRGPAPPDPEALEAAAVVAGDEAGALLAGPEAPLVADAAAVRALRARVEADAAAAAAAGLAPSPRAARGRERVTALAALLALAEGDLAGASAVAEAGAAARDLEGQVLRAGVAALTSAADALTAAADLGRALERGATRPELRAWRARALVRAGLEGPGRAALAAGDLDRVAAARPLDEGELAARALAGALAGDAPGATRALAALGERAPAELRWAVGLAQAGVALQENDPARARAALGGLTPPPPAASAAAAGRVGRAALDALRRADAAAPTGSLADLLEVATRALPPAEAAAAAAPLVARAIAWRAELTDGDVRLGVAVCAARPDDAVAHRAVALLTQQVRGRGNHLLLAPVVARAPTLERDPARRLELEVLRCEQAAWLAMREADRTGAPPSLEQGQACEALADALLGQATEPSLRARLLGLRAQGRRAQGRLASALADLDAAAALGPGDVLMPLWRGLCLLDLRREGEAVEALAEYVRAQSQEFAEVGRAERELWARRARDPARVRAALEHAATFDPPDASPLLRVAALRLEAGDDAGAGEALTRAAAALETEAAGDTRNPDAVRACAARAKALAAGPRTAAAVVALLDAVDAARG